MLKRFIAVGAVALVSALAPYSSSQASEAPGQCWSCDTDWFASGQCWLHDTHMHETIGTWYFDGHASSHGWVCGTCRSHEMVNQDCEGSNNLAVELNEAVEKESDVRALLANNAHLAALDPSSGVVTILDCGSGDVHSQVTLTAKQMEMLVEAPTRLAT